MQISCSLEDSVIRIRDMAMVVHRMERETYVVIYGVQTHCANVWEAIFAHACKCEKMAFTGVLAAFAVILLVLSAVIETSSLFLIVAAAFCVGIVLREWGIKAGAAFLAASFLVGLIVAPNRLYCITFLAMGIYLVLSEILWEKVAQSSKIQKKTVAVWIGKYIIFNAMFIPVLLIFPTLILAEEAVERCFGLS